MNQQTPKLLTCENLNMEEKPTGPCPVKVKTSTNKN